MSHECPDKTCQAKVEEIYVDMKAKSKIFNITRLIWGSCGLAIIVTILYMWSDWKALPRTYCTIEEARAIEAEAIKRDAEIVLKQAEASKDIQYLKQGIDDIKVMLIRISKREK